MRRLVLLLVAGYLFAACGGSSSGDTNTPTSAPLNTAQAVHERLTSGGVNCTNFKMAGSDKAIYTREEASCDIGDESLTISTFDGAGTRDGWLKVAKQFGGIYVVGPTWIVMVDSQATAEKVQGAIGGEIQ